MDEWAGQGREAAGQTGARVALIAPPREQTGPNHPPNEHAERRGRADTHCELACERASPRATEPASARANELKGFWGFHVETSRFSTNLFPFVFLWSQNYAVVVKHKGRVMTHTPTGAPPRWE